MVFEQEKTEIAGEDFSRRVFIIVLALIAAVSVFSLLFFDNALQARATLIAGVCLILWLSEIVPAYVPTFVLWALTTILLAPLSKNYAFGEVL